MVRAVAVALGALEVLTRETYPFYWAEITDNLGMALEALGRRGGDAARLRHAIGCHRGALEVFKEADAPWQIRRARESLERAESSLKQVSGDSA